MDDFEDEIHEEDNIYDEKQRESQVEDGEISAEEEAFMRGYEEAAELDDDE